MRPFFRPALVAAALCAALATASPARNVEVTDYEVEQFLDELGYLEGLTDVVDGDISGPTFNAIARFSEDHGVPYDGIWTSPEIRAALKKAVEAKRAETGGAAPEREMAEIPLPEAVTLHFDRIDTRDGVEIGIATAHDCADDIAPVVIISDAPDLLPGAGHVNAAIRYMSRHLSPECQSAGRTMTVFVVNSQGEYSGMAYLVHPGGNGWAFPYHRLTDDMVRWLRDDPGLPFARIAPDFINLVSGEWRDHRYHIGGAAQMKSIFFQFSLAEARLCPETVGETSTYRITRTETNEYGVTTTDTEEYTFDKDHEDLLVAILEEGNHIGSRLRTFSGQLINRYGCTSPEISMMREDLVAFARDVLQ